jgi:hypothetical protein
MPAGDSAAACKAITAAFALLSAGRAHAPERPRSFRGRRITARAAFVGGEARKEGRRRRRGPPSAQPSASRDCQRSPEARGAQCGYWHKRARRGRSSAAFSAVHKRGRRGVIDCQQHRRRGAAHADAAAWRAKCWSAAPSSPGCCRARALSKGAAHNAAARFHEACPRQSTPARLRQARSTTEAHCSRNRVAFRRAVVATNRLLDRPAKWYRQSEPRSLPLLRRMDALLLPPRCVRAARGPALLRALACGRRHDGTAGCGER